MTSLSEWDKDHQYDYLKLAEAPRMILQSPLCGACFKDLESDADGYVCPNCGTYWSVYGGKEEGTLYEEWAGSPLAGKPVSHQAAYFTDWYGVMTGEERQRAAEEYDERNK